MASIFEALKGTVKCCECGKNWPKKEAFYDKDGNTYCSHECVRTRQMRTDNDFKVEKGNKPQ